MDSKDLLHTISLSPVFSELTRDSLDQLVDSASILSIQQGQTLLRNHVFETHVFIVKSGKIRLLAEHPYKSELFTIGFAKQGDLIGFISLLRQEACEPCIASTPCELISFPIKSILELIQTDSNFAQNLQGIISPSEISSLVSRYLRNLNPPSADPKQFVLDSIANTQNSEGNSRYVLSSVVPDFDINVGSEISDDECELLKTKSQLPIRRINVCFSSAHQDTPDLSNNSNVQVSNPDLHTKTPASWMYTESFDLSDLGLKEARSAADLQGFKLIKGDGVVLENLAILRMVANAYGVPCPVDVIEKALEGVVSRSGSVPIQAMGELAEMMGFQTQLGSLKLSLLSKLELPVIVKFKNKYNVLSDVSSQTLQLADPSAGWVDLSFDQLVRDDITELEVLLVKRLSDTPKKTFGWSWFSPVLKRFKWPLVQVLLASLFIQLFQLANPLLLQQIIDKVINQSNLSALQILGAALVAAAFFQGLLTTVRTWLMIDTTDRMDLVLGSQVIDKLLRLPLRFFEKRPVGELSQRLGELANIRSFLTGTAITSLLDLLFATIYIFIMFVYSPLLAVVALITIPIYILMIIFIAPLYRSLIRKQAQYSAKTQSHLIETLSGIQTVKAQHFELNSRWRWQERYSGQIQEGFKSVVLGSTAGEFGNFLNQLSSLLIIWVGVYQVVDGQLSLGQLIAFRIIAGYVTGPILRLSGLWQGFQQVGISMERLSDIVDQVPEAGELESSQIALPPIKGNILFENVKFRFASKKGPYQIKNFNFEVKEGSFVGIVGLSGSGKSTLMKLLPRLYSVNEGRILIDGYDISKVTLNSVRQQIGIVPQDCLLFEGSIRQNISMNNPEAPTEEIIRVAKAAEAHDFIMELPDGYGTILGERGAGLSGGQRQRIAIARTLLQNPNLLILDEATSALDYETESSLCRNLQRELKGKTVFFITHRLSTIKSADQIVLMSDGLLSEQGTHEELISLGGRYATLYSHQDE